VFKVCSNSSDEFQFLAFPRFLPGPNPKVKAENRSSACRAGSGPIKHRSGWARFNFTGMAVGGPGMYEDRMGRAEKDRPLLPTMAAYACSAL